MSENENTSLARTISWKQGMLIALGVPLLILPSLYDVAGVLWGFSIIMWTVSVLQGFLQNSAYAEMVTVFPNATGLPGCAQAVFTPEQSKSKYDKGKFIGAFCAWAYWFAWTPVVAIFTILIGDYLVSYLPDVFGGINYTLLTVIIGIIIVSGMTLMGSRGLTGGARMGLILAIIAIVPLVVILMATLFTGVFEFSNITEGFLPTSWTWSGVDIVMLFGCFALAQWSGCAWETAAVYGPEYKNPGTDVPKALFSCGIICLILYFLVSTTVFGSLGIEGVDDAGYATLVPIAVAVFGEAGSYVALTLLVAAMILIIQTGFLGSSRTLHSMSQEGNLPRFIGKVNKHGMPIIAMIIVSAVNLLLIFIGNPVAILAASSLGYCCANVIALAAYYVTKTNPRFKDLKRPWSAPRGWKFVALALFIYELIILIPCLVYWNSSIFGATPTLIGVIMLTIFVPIWILVQRYEGGKRAVQEDQI